MTSTPYDCIVIGAGVTGLSAASQLAGMGRSTAYVEPMMFGGLVINIRELEYGQVGDEPKSGFSYVYKVNNNEFYDVTGLLHGTEYRDYSQTPSIWRWTRVIERAADGAAEPGTVNSDTGRAAPRDQDSQGTVLIKNVTLTSIDEASGVISGTIRDEDRAAQLVNVRLAAGVRLVASHVIPTVNNHMPFEWQNLRRLKGKVVSIRIRIRTSEHGISVASISARND